MNDEHDKQDIPKDFSRVLDARLSRRTLLQGSLVLAAGSYIGVGTVTGSLLLAPGTDASAANRRDASLPSLKLNFAAVDKSKADALQLAAGYSYSVLMATGDPLVSSLPAYANDGSDPAASFARRAGDHNDGMHYFGLGKDDHWDPVQAERALLCVNHENITAPFLHPQGQTIVDGRRTDAAEVMKEMLVHGVSVVEIVRNGDGGNGDGGNAGNGSVGSSGGTRRGYQLKRDSRFNRRITTLTDMEISGPAARSPLMITKYSITGTRTRGTLANCANGHTPWGTYLTCEENWAGFFQRPPSDDRKRSAKELAAFQRYGVGGKGHHLWATVQPDTADHRFGRWHAGVTGTSTDGSDDYRNVANTYGWVVEINPFDPASTPKKRTALGRFAHEGAWPARVVAGEPLVWYMGCDSRGEYIYKYVSNAVWDPADAKRPAMAGDKYLDDGTLYVARFAADGSGEWLPLKLGDHGIDANYAPYPFANQADVLVHARLAADAAGATKMDRPEWGAVNPRNGEVYMTLTYNPSRDFDKVDAANPRFYNDPKQGKPQKGNANGHIIRWAEQDGKAAATRFRWDVFLFAARASADRRHVNLSGLNAGNDFSSPDGLWFARSGLLWIQTDDHAYTDISNCMLLAALPGQVGDGTTTTITNRDGERERQVSTHVGAAATDSSLRRFLVGPVDCEITGLAESPDGRALFVNIQHPGETTNGMDFDIANPASWRSHWPAGGNARPRSATIVITRDDDGLIGADPI